MSDGIASKQVTHWQVTYPDSDEVDVFGEDEDNARDWVEFQQPTGILHKRVVTIAYTYGDWQRA